VAILDGVLSVSALEKHYSVDELSAMWGLSDKTIRKLFINEPGVMKIGSPSRLVGRGKYKRRYYTLHTGVDCGQRSQEGCEAMSCAFTPN
jgi:hypothetical protein